MELASEFTSAAAWLNETFYSFDHYWLHFWHQIAQEYGGILTPFMKLISLLGKGGIFMILLSLTLCIFKKTRLMGITMLIALAIGAVFTNLILKNMIARPRPYDTTAEFRMWWQAVGGALMSDASFPSGHTTVAADSMTVLFLRTRKPGLKVLAVLFPIIMMISRVYLAVHYPSDVLAGLVIGIIAGIMSYYLINHMPPAWQQRMGIAS